MTLHRRAKGSSKHCCTGAGTISVSGVAGQSQQLTLLEVKVSLTGNEWQKHSIVTGPETPEHPLPRLPHKGVLPRTQNVLLGFCYSCLGDSRNETATYLTPSPGGHFWCGQRTTGAITMVHWTRNHTIRKLICHMESQGAISRNHSPSNSPIWPVQTNSTLSWPGQSHAPAESSCARPAGTSVQTGVRGSQAQLILLVQFSQATGNREQAHPEHLEFQGWKHRPTISHGLI